MDARQLAATLSSLQAAVSAHMKQHPPTDTPPVPGPHTAPSTTPADSATNGAVPILPLAILHGWDSITMCAAFGCIAHCLQIHRKLQHTLTTTSARAAVGRSQQSFPAGLGQGATSHKLQDAGHAPPGDSADKDAHVGMSDEDLQVFPWPRMLQNVPGQVEWLTHILKLPWQLQSAGSEAPPGR